MSHPRGSGRARTYSLVEPSCPICDDKEKVLLIPLPLNFTELSGFPETVTCPHCGPSHVPISTYFTRGKS